MSEKFLLNCSILGRDVERVFPVIISPSRTVGQLKDAIKAAVTIKLAQIDALDLDLWKLLNPLSRGDIATTLGEIVKGANIPGVLQLKPMEELSFYFPAHPVPKKLHLVVQIPHPVTSPATDDDLIKLTSAPYKTIGAVAPSQFAVPTHHISLLKECAPGTALFMFNRPTTSNRVPITLLSEIFARFEVNFHEGCGVSPGVKEFMATRELMYGLSKLYESEADRQTFINGWLAKHFDVNLSTKYTDITSRASDRHDTVEALGVSFLRLVSEGTLSFGGSSGDPIVQGAYYYRDFYLYQANILPKHGGCKPALLLVYAGHVITVYGLAMHHDGTVQVEPLTWVMVTDCDWNDTKHKQWFYRFVSALDHVLKDLKEYYEQPPSNPSESYDYSLPSLPDDVEETATKRRRLSVRCWFPYPRSYVGLSGGEKVSFSFERRLYHDRLLFTAVKNDSGEKILVKFTRRYGKAAHELLAAHNLAPALYGCEEVLKDFEWTLVSMEYLPQTDWVPMALKTRAQQVQYGPKIKEALEHLWRAGWVHGDVRHHNILVPSSDAKIDIRIIDFDYCGRIGIDRYPPDWDDTFRHVNAVGGALMEKAHDETMFNLLFELQAVNSGGGMAVW